MPEFKFKTAAVHHLYISEDDGLGRYKVQTKEGEILQQFFVPAGYVERCHNICKELFDDFKVLQQESDVYSRQTRWCKLQDDSIHLINQILGELKSDLKQEIDKSLDHSVMSLASSISKCKQTLMVIMSHCKGKKDTLVEFREHFLNSRNGYSSRRNRTFL